MPGHGFIADRDTGKQVEHRHSIFYPGALQGGGASVDECTTKRGARNRVRSKKFRDATIYLSSVELGASQRRSAEANGMSPAWVKALRQWRRSGIGIDRAADQAPEIAAVGTARSPCRLQLLHRKSTAVMAHNQVAKKADFLKFS